MKGKEYKMNILNTIKIRKIEFDCELNQWVGFNTPSDTESSFWNSTIQNDFKDFIATELVKARKLLEEL